jgi:TRAP-type mannitol/chloroaromatic compound transport system permease small subunit
MEPPNGGFKMRYLRWIEVVSECAGRFASYLIMILVVIVCFDVLMRYLLNSPTTWAFDAALHLYSIAFLVGGSWVLKMKAHIKVDVLYNLFPLRMRAIINLICYLFLLFPLCYFLLKDGSVYAYTSWKMSEVSQSSPLHEPIWPLKTFIPLAFLLLWLQGIVEFVRDLAIVKRGTSD